MIKETTLQKLEVLADAAKYDVSCASSGSRRANTSTGLGHSTGNGICHSYTPDGRCVSLLKILLTNHCIYDCAYCVSRRSNDVRRVAFTVEEVVDLTIGFYRRNYIEGLFLSSGIFKNADYTTERLVRVARTLRTEHAFNGYIHLKVIPGASDDLIAEAGRWADRLSVNLEIPSEEGLRKVAPEKDYASALTPMARLRDRIEEGRTARKESPKAPAFAPGGQSTQLVIGATDEDDRQVLNLASRLYRHERLRRVYYSGYVPVSADDRVPQRRQTPVVREHRLYQADWLMRYYGYEAGELVDDRDRWLDLHVDPKLSYALRHPECFPVDVNTADRDWLLRVPGLGVRSAERILAARRRVTLRWEDLRKVGVVLKRARYFLHVPDHHDGLLEQAPDLVRARLVQPMAMRHAQLDLFGGAR